MVPIIRVQNVSKVFREGSAVPVPALSSVSLEIEEGAFVSLCGPSGSGKTTLLNLLGCLDRPTEGRIEIAGEEVSRLEQRKLTNFRRHKIGFIFQDFNLIPTLTAIENIEYVLWLQGISSGDRNTRALEICRRFGIEN